MNDIWWLWEGAAVRIDGNDNPAVIVPDWYSSAPDGMIEVNHTGVEDSFNYSFDRIIPIENPAVMLAPEWATKVRISASVHSTRSGLKRIEIVNMTYFEKDDPGQMLYTDIYWPQCPDHLKGQTWPLPERKK